MVDYLYRIHRKKGSEKMLQLYLFKVVCYESSRMPDGAVRLMTYSKAAGVPQSTHYRAVKKLIDDDLIQRVGSDLYKVSDNLVECLFLQGERMGLGA